MANNESRREKTNKNTLPQAEQRVRSKGEYGGHYDALSIRNVRTDTYRKIAPMIKEMMWENYYEEKVRRFIWNCI